MSAHAYKTLVDRYGADRVATALLAKWLADPEAEGSWHMLMDAILDAEPGRPRAMSPKRKPRDPVPSVFYREAA